LLARHRATWLGPVWDVVYRVPFNGGDRFYYPRFVRGFFEEAATSFRSARIPGIGDPRWSTVRTLCASDNLTNTDGSLWKQALALYVHDVLRPLLHLTSAHPDTAVAFLEDPRPRRLQTLGVFGDPNDASHRPLRAALAAGTGLPELRELKLVGALRPHDYDWLFATPLGARLQTLTFYGRPPDVAAWLAATWLPARLATIRFLHASTILTLERDAAGEWRSDVEPRPIVGPRPGDAPPPWLV
jgi:hypothetical protein